MIEGTPKTKAPTIVAAVVIPITRLTACKAYTRCATLTSAGDGSPGSTIVSDMSLAPLMSAVKSRQWFVCVKSYHYDHKTRRVFCWSVHFHSKVGATRCKRICSLIVFLLD